MTNELNVSIVCLDHASSGWTGGGVVWGGAGRIRESLELMPINGAVAIWNRNKDDGIPQTRRHRKGAEFNYPSHC